MLRSMLIDIVRRVAAVLLVSSVVAVLAAPVRCQAQAVQPREALEDAKLYFTAPLRWDQRDWLEFGGTLAAIAVTYHFDDQIQSHFAGSSGNGQNSNSSSSSQDFVPAAVLLAGTWILAAAVDVPSGWQELGSMLEATVLSATTCEILKYSLGRLGPDQTDSPSRWFAGGDSFPSQHTNVAFAIGTVLAESGSDQYRWLRRILGYGVAGYTAYSRLDHNAHWGSDVVAGAALGFSTARFTMNRRTGAVQQTSFDVVPTGDGVMLAFTMPLH
jgi:membrane-associated phospholipid phosphatase